MNFEQETLKEIYNLCSHQKKKEGDAGTLAKMICEKIETLNKPKDLIKYYTQK